MRFNDQWIAVAGLRRDEFDAHISNTVSLPAYAQQTVYDRTSWKNLKSATESQKAAQLTADDARNWIVAKQKEHMRGCTIYCSQANLNSVWSACKGHAYYIWVADWTGSAHEVAHTVATQYSSVDNRYDLSMVYSQEWLDTVQAANDPWPIS